MSARRLARLTALLAATLLLTTAAGCLTGERPSFSDDHTAPGATTGDAAIDAVLERLDGGGDAQFVAEYDILTRYRSTESTATVVQADSNQWRIVIGDVEFTVRGGNVSTCQTDGSRCADGIRDQRVSDLQVTHRFYGAGAAAKLRQDAANRVSDGEASTQRFDGRTATCATVAVSGGEKRYCALDSGALALQDGPDVQIELRSITNEVTHSALEGA